MIMIMIKITSKNNKKSLRSTVITEKMVVAHVNKKFPAFHGTRSSLQYSYDTALEMDPVPSQMNCNIPVLLSYEQL
jgi:hypothetical protein